MVADREELCEREKGVRSSKSLRPSPRRLRGTTGMQRSGRTDLSTSVMSLERTSCAAAYMWLAMTYCAGRRLSVRAQVRTHRQAAVHAEEESVEGREVAWKRKAGEKRVQRLEGKGGLRIAMRVSTATSTNVQPTTCCSASRQQV